MTMKITKIALLLLSIMPASHGSASNGGDSTRNRVALYTVALVATFGAGWLVGKMCQRKPAQPSIPTQARDDASDGGSIYQQPHPPGTLTALSYLGYWNQNSIRREESSSKLAGKTMLELGGTEAVDELFVGIDLAEPLNVSPHGNPRAFSRSKTTTPFGRTGYYVVTKGNATARIAGSSTPVTTKWSLAQTPRAVIFYDHEIGKLNILPLQSGTSPRLYLEAEDNITNCLETPYFDSKWQLVVGVVRQNTSFAHAHDITYTLHVPDPNSIIVHTGHEQMV